MRHVCMSHNCHHNYYNDNDNDDNDNDNNDSIRQLCCFPMGHFCSLQRFMWWWLADFDANDSYSAARKWPCMSSADHGRTMCYCSVSHNNHHHNYNNNNDHHNDHHNNHHVYNNNNDHDVLFPAVDARLQFILR